MDGSHSETLCGRRAILEALRAGRSCRRLFVAQGTHGPSIDEIFALVRSQRIPYDAVERSQLDRMAGPHHQGVVALLAARAYVDYERLLEQAAGTSAFLVYLDSIQDPHNLGAILRSAHALGADGLVIPQRHACGLTAAAVKASAGAADHLPVSQVPNLVRALRQAQEAGIWVAGLAAEGDTDLRSADWRSPCALVVGSEGKGLRRLVRQTCDRLVRIPMARTQVGSFNASVAAALALFEVFRQRTGAPD